MKRRQIERRARTIPVDRTAIDHERILGDAEAALAASAGPERIRPRPAFGRIIMKNKATRLGMAAAIVVAATVAITHFGPSIDGSTTVLAKAVQNMARTDSAMWRATRTFAYDGGEITYLNSDAVWYYSSQHGAREDVHDREGRLLHQAYWLPQQDVRIRVIPPMKQYECMKLTEAERMAWGQPDVQAIVDLIESLEPIPLGRKEIDGRVTEGFEIPGSDPCFQIINAQMAAVSPITSEEGVIRIWIDLETSLPLRYEAELLTIHTPITSLTGGKPVRVTVTGYAFRWNVEMEPDVHEPNLPVDYTPFEWWPAGCYPAYDVPDQEIRDAGGIWEWLALNDLSPGDYGWFHRSRRGNCLRMNNRFLANIAVFEFQGEPNDLRDLHNTLATWFLGTPTATKAYYGKLGDDKAELLLEYARSHGALTLLAQRQVTVENGHRHLIDIGDVGSAVLRVLQPYKAPSLDVSLAFFSEQQAAADIPSVKVDPGEAVLIKFAEPTTLGPNDGTPGTVFILVRLQALRQE